MSTGKTLLGLAAGLAAGAVLGILFAPAKGKDTRNKISKKGEKIVEDLKTKFDEFLENITRKYENTADDVSDFAKTGKNKMEGSYEEMK
jgi:gas vesicle protein